MIPAPRTTSNGFDIAEVVAEYNILRGCVHDLADRNGLNLQGKPFHILNRLLDGAIPPRGSVTIGARELDPQTGVECWVSDNGTGVPDEILDKVFEKGETDPENEGGTGLGLAIVKTFIEAHGGTIGLESKVGVGSTFRFSLPNKTHASN